MKNKLHSVFIGLSFLTALHHAAAQSTAFTYQGRLNDNGGPANGTYDLQFTVFDAGAGPNLVAGPLTNAATFVSNGEFLVALDFGDGVFTGPERWLEIAVRTNGNGAFGTLSPRQPITPTPYAIYAANAGNAATAAVAASANSVSAANLTGTVADSQLSSNIVRLAIPNTTTQATGGVVVTSGFVTSAYVTNGGSGYTLPPTVTVLDVSGSNAVIIATVSNGVVVGLAVQNPGIQYSTNATLTIAPPPSNAYQTFTSGNVFNGVSTFTSANGTFAGSFAGNGAGMTNVNLTGPSALSALGNTANGYQALYNDTSGYWNTANGFQALFYNTTGYKNTANGYQALFYNTDGYANTANGESALSHNTSGHWNTANGAQALYHNTSGHQNTASGFQALYRNTTGSNNTANGYQTLFSSTTGSYNDASGFQALYNNTTGNNNTANGYQALFSNTTGNYNTADGWHALYSNTTGTGNIASGVNALADNTTGNYNTAAGYRALKFNTTGSNNVANGIASLEANTSGNNNTANGHAALNLNTSGNFNTADGDSALHNNTTGSNNIAFGYQGGYNLTTGSSNIDIGNLGLAADNNIIRIGSGQTQAFIAGVITGNGAGLTSLNPMNLGSGTAAINISGTAAAATTAASVTGNIADSQLSANVALLNGTNSFTGTNTFAGTIIATNASNVVSGTFRGDGSGLTGITLATPPPGMALIPAGSFTMGNSIGDPDISDATPISVSVSAFYMDVNLVSWSQWQSVYFWAADHGYGFANLGAGKAANHPAQSVDWNDAVKWCNARSQQAGRPPVYYTDVGLTQVYTNGEVATLYPNWAASGYRLPTEAEWEKAARGGLSGQRFPWGNVINQNLANYNGATASHAYDLGPNGYNAIGSIGGTNPATSPVGSFAANGYGVYDMAGNVVEWCWDWYETPYAGGSDPHGPAGPWTYRVLRGGAWSGSAIYEQCAYRHLNYPNAALNNIGFRCVRGL